jgi:hypothetical protein
MLLLPKNTLESLVASSATYPAATATALLSAMKTIWKVAVAATRWLKDKFTGHVPTWRLRSWNVKGNIKIGDFSMDYLSESSNHPAAMPKYRKNGKTEAKPRLYRQANPKPR